VVLSKILHHPGLGETKKVPSISSSVAIYNDRLFKKATNLAYNTAQTPWLHWTRGWDSVCFMT